MNKKFVALILLLLVFVGSGFTYAGTAVEQTVANSVSAAMAAVNINVESENSVVKIMKDITIPAGETVNGDVVAVLGDVRIDGEVNGNVIAVLGDIELNNIVRGDVVSVMGEVAKGPNAKIIGQTIETNRPGNFNIPNFSGLPFRANPFHLGWSFRLFQLVLLFGLAALTLALLPENVRNMANALGSDAGRKLLIGFVAILLVPALFFISAISLIGIPLIPFIALALVTGKFIGYVAIAMLVGSRIRQTGGMNSSAFLELFLGVLILWVVRQVPLLGWFSAGLVTMFALGLVLDTKFGSNNPWFRRKTVNPTPPPAAPTDNDAVNVPPAAEEEGK